MAELTHNQQLEHLLHAINHDLRTPLSNIRSAASILLQDHSDPLSEDQRIFIKIIEHATVRLLDQSNRLLLLNQIAFATFDPEPTRLSELFAKTKSILKNGYGIQNVTPVMKEDPQISCDEQTLPTTLAMLAAGDSKQEPKQPPSQPPGIHAQISSGKICFIIQSLMPSHEMAPSLIELANHIVQQHGSQLEITDNNQQKLFKFCLPIFRVH